jgi:hypothetical protein
MRRPPGGRRKADAKMSATRAVLGCGRRSPRASARSGRRTAAASLIFALACGSPPEKPSSPPARQDVPPTETAIGQAALAALAAAPWDTDPTGSGSLCTPAAPCDTLVVDPRVVVLPVQAPAFFVPDRRDAAAKLTPHAVSLASIPGRHIRLGAWSACSPRRDAPTWSRGRIACVALGIAGPETARSDAITFALLVASPAKGLNWPRIRVTRPREAWRGRLLSNAGE